MFYLSGHALEECVKRIMDARTLLELVIIEVDCYKHWNISDFLYDEISNFLEQSKSDPDSIDLQSQCRGDKL